MTYRFRAACGRLQRDPGHLRLRDRAALRILNRAQAATAAQLSVLVYGHRRVAQEQLRRLWLWGYLERAAIPPASPRGGPALAYRLSAACLRRLGYPRDRWRGPGYLAHTLDAVEAVCALVRVNRSDPPLVQLWLPESIVRDLVPDTVLPDAVLALATGSGSGVLCLEIDEATQHVAPIRAKLLAYRRALDGRPGWHALFVVPTTARLNWLRRAASSLDLEGASLWALVSDELSRACAGARLTRLDGRGGGLTLRDVLRDPRPRLSSAPVASRAWLELLGSGGGEDLDGVRR